MASRLLVAKVLGRGFLGHRGQLWTRPPLGAREAPGGLLGCMRIGQTWPSHQSPFPEGHLPFKGQ